jgi:2-iminobutanoate/2-iminopropanoate deaminase
MDNIEAILGEAGASLQDVVKASVYLAVFSDFSEMNEVYRQRMPVPPPTRTTVGAVLPVGVLVEIDVIAVGNGPEESQRG